MFFSLTFEPKHFSSLERHSNQKVSSYAIGATTLSIMTLSLTALNTGILSVLQMGS